MSEVPVSDLILEFSRWMELNKGSSRATIDKYLGHLRWLDRWLSTRDLSLLDATRRHLEEFAGLEAHKAGLKPRARAPLVAAIRGFYKWAHSMRLVRANPAETLPYPRSGSPLPTPLALHHAERLMMQPDLNTFIGLRDAAIMALLLGTGLRVSGLVGLNESSLHWSFDDQGVERLTIKVTEKGGKDRFIPVPHEARLLLRAYLGHEYLDTVDRALPSRDKVLFISTVNSHVPAHEYYGEARRLRRGAIQTIIIKYGTMAGIPRDQLHPHAMRHLFGTELVESGTDLLTVQTLMGHADSKSSMIYTHLAMRTLQRRVDEANPLGKIQTPVTSLARQLTKRAR